MPGFRRYQTGTFHPSRDESEMRGNDGEPTGGFRGFPAISRQSYGRVSWESPFTPGTGPARAPVGCVRRHRPRHTQSQCRSILILRWIILPITAGSAFACHVLVDIGELDRHVLGRLDPYVRRIAPDPKRPDRDVLPDHHALASPPCKYQMPSSLYAAVFGGR